MNKRKGLSQVLSLIVAASVLMMTALTVIFMVSGGLGDFGETTQNSGCLNAVETQCRVSGTTKIDIPATCVSDEEVIQSLTQSEYGVDGEGSDAEITC